MRIWRIGFWQSLPLFTWPPLSRRGLVSGSSAAQVPQQVGQLRQRGAPPLGDALGAVGGPGAGGGGRSAASGVGTVVVEALDRGDLGGGVAAARGETTKATAHDVLQQFRVASFCRKKAFFFFFIFRTHVLHLLPQQVVDSVSALPHQAHLVAQDGQVTHEAVLHRQALPVTDESEGAGRKISCYRLPTVLTCTEAFLAIIRMQRNQEGIATNGV